MAILSDLGYEWPNCDTSALGASSQFGETLLTALNPVLGIFNAASGQVLCASVLPNLVPSKQRMNDAIGAANPETDKLYKSKVSFNGVQTRVLVTRPMRLEETDKRVVLLPGGNNVVAYQKHFDDGLIVGVQPMSRYEMLMANALMKASVVPTLKNLSGYMDTTLRWQGLFYLYDMIMLERNGV